MERWVVALALLGCGMHRSTRAVGDGTYVLSSTGSARTTIEDTEVDVIKRADEVCPSGFDVLSAGSGSETRAVIAQPLGNGAIAYGVNQPRTSAVIRCRPDEEPGLNAAAVQTPVRPPNTALEPWARRRIWAARLRHRLLESVPSIDVSTEGDSDDILVVTSELCGNLLTFFVAKNGGHVAFTDQGFVRVDCRGGANDETEQLEER